MKSPTALLKNLIQALKDKRLNKIVQVFTTAETELKQLIDDEDKNYNNLHKQVQQLQNEKADCTIRAARANQWLKLIPKLDKWHQ